MDLDQHEAEAARLFAGEPEHQAWFDAILRAEAGKPDPCELGAYADAGFRLIPLDGKRPRDKGWVHRAYDAAELKERLARGEGNVGVQLTAESLVSDVDPRNDLLDRSADELFEALQRKLGIDLSNAPRVRTGSGGLHVYLRKPADVKRGELLPGFGKAIEFKSEGRQMVAAGSIHPETGQRYRWDQRTSARLDFGVLDAASGERTPVTLADLIIDAPQALLDALSGQEAGGGAEAQYERRDWSSDAPPERVQQVLDSHADVRARFEGEIEGLDDHSDSGIDMSLASLLARHGCAGWEIEASLRLSRERRGARKSPEEKGDDYFVRTVNKALRQAGSDPGGSRASSNATGGQGVAAADGGGEAAQPVPMVRTHAGNAARLVREHGHELRYVQSLNAWIHFDGKRWRMDHGLSAKRLAKSAAIRIFAEAGALQGNDQQVALKWASASQMAHGVRGTIEMAQPDLEISSRRLDPNPMLLNVSNGTLDLRTHQLRPHDPADMITKVAPTAYDPAARCEHWERFLEQVLPDEDVRAFFQRLMGYALQGRQSEKIFAIVYGPPNGGKSTAINACARALGNASKGEDATDDDDSAAVTRFYAEGTPISTFGVQKYGGGNRPELAKLMGARLVIVNEIKGEELESSVMKSWTGGDVVSATPKYGHPLGFYADGTIIMVGNELPEIDFDDDAMWSRVVVVRFPVEIPDQERDRGLSGRFDPKGVLAWMVQGHAEYARIGLQPPKASRLEKKRYRSASDPLSEFWEDCVVETHGDVQGAGESRISRDELYQEYQMWADQAGVPARDRISRDALVKRVNRRAELSGSIRWRKTGAWRGWVGARLARSEDTR